MGQEIIKEKFDSLFNEIKENKENKFYENNGIVINPDKIWDMFIFYE